MRGLSKSPINLEGLDIGQSANSSHPGIVLSTNLTMVNPSHTDVDLGPISLSLNVASLPGDRRIVIPNETARQLGDISIPSFHLKCCNQTSRVQAKVLFRPKSEQAKRVFMANFVSGYYTHGGRGWGMCLGV